MKKKNIYKNIFVVVCFFYVEFVLQSQTISPFNKKQLVDTSADYSFLVSGHFYGESTNASTYPASTLLGNIDELNGLHPSFLISLGDMFIDVNDTYLNHYQKSLFDKVNFPIFNAVGNHDLANGNLYESKFGKSFFSFVKNKELIIILNTELTDGSIKGEQLEFLKSILATEKIIGINHIFLFSHRAIWAESLTEYVALFKGNTRSTIGSNNFVSVIYPMLKDIAKTKSVYWISGSSGGGPASFFYDKNKESNIIFMHSAIRNSAHDAMLQITIKNNAVALSGISLTDSPVKKIEEYNLSYWISTTPDDQKFNFRLLPLYTKQFIFNKYFGVGLLSGMILLIIFNKLRSRKKN